MKQDHMQMGQETARPERVAWYRDLVAEMTGSVPIVRVTTVPVLIDGLYWQVRQVIASVPAFVSPAGCQQRALRAGAETEEEALRALCEQVHALTWGEWAVWVMPVGEMEAALVGAM